MEAVAAVSGFEVCVGNSTYVNSGDYCRVGGGTCRRVRSSDPL